MPVFKSPIGEWPDRQNVDLIDSDLDSPDGKVAVPVQPFLHNFFTK
jgi:hypothetical protein